VDHIIAMRKVLPAALPVALLLAVAGCGTPARWEKPGVTAEATAADAVDCRRAASQEAFVYSPYGWAPPLWPGRRGYWLNWYQLQQSERFYAENRLTAFCMRNKGYELVPIPRPPG
jgi:hypothetical protein